MYVDALGPTKPYEAYLSSTFPGINFTVAAKADSKFKIVGAASVAAKVTRDASVEGWVFEEHQPIGQLPDDAEEQPEKSRWGSELGSGYPAGRMVPLLAQARVLMCPSDPKTQAWIKGSLDPTFGFPSLVRFSWTTVKIVLEKNGHPVQWYALRLEYGLLT